MQSPAGGTPSPPTGTNHPWSASESVRPVESIRITSREQRLTALRTASQFFNLPGRPWRRAGGRGRVVHVLLDLVTDLDELVDRDAHRVVQEAGITSRGTRVVDGVVGTLGGPVGITEQPHDGAQMGVAPRDAVQPLGQRRPGTSDVRDDSGTTVASTGWRHSCRCHSESLHFARHSAARRSISSGVGSGCFAFSAMASLGGESRRHAETRQERFCVRPRNVEKTAISRCRRPVGRRPGRSSWRSPSSAVRRQRGSAGATRS
jgi:hypothetical protein